MVLELMHEILILLDQPTSHRPLLLILDIPGFLLLLEALLDSLPESVGFVLLLIFQLIKKISDFGVPSN